MRTVVAIAVVLAGVFASAGAQAQDAIECDSCASCTLDLGEPQARVALIADLTVTGGTPCIVVRGPGAWLNGRDHTVRGAAGAAAVRIETTDAGVRNVRVVGGAIGFEVVAARDATLYHVRTDGCDTGIRVAASSGARIVRAELHGGLVGLAAGSVEAEHCIAAAALRSPGLVVRRSRIESATVGIAACEARPVLANNVVTGASVGVLLGNPRALPAAPPRDTAPWDACVCAPTLDAVHAGTTMLFSSGCGGCQVHEGWLPALRASGHDIRLREVGVEHQAEAARFDAYAAHCAPELIDALGIPGCVPNYECVASGEVAKTRGTDAALVVESALDSQDDVAHFAEACATFARDAYRTGPACVVHGLRGNSLCGNRAADVRVEPGATWSGVENACQHVVGVSGTAIGCTASCGAMPANAPAQHIAAFHPLAPSGSANRANAAPPAPPPPAPPPAAVVPSVPAPPPPPASATALPSVDEAPAHARVPAPPKQHWGIAIAALAGIAGLLAWTFLKPDRPRR